MNFIMKLIDRWFPVEIINGNGICEVYLRRRELLRLFGKKGVSGSGWRVYLHHFLADDWSLDEHNHPKWFLSIGLWGKYAEQMTYYDVAIEGERTIYRTWYAPWIRWFPASHRHRIVLFKDKAGKPIPAWTIVITPPSSAVWGWFARRGWVESEEYMSSIDALERRSCP